MRYVIIRDDDTNALTPVSCLERLYRPFIERGMPVNLAVIPEVATGTCMGSGQPEGFLLPAAGEAAPRRSSEPLQACAVRHERLDKLPMAANQELVGYLLSHPSYRVVQHGSHHDYLEFDQPDGAEIARRLDRGSNALREAGLGQPRTFVAPYDKLSSAALRKVADRFAVLSGGWYELRRLPWSWWPGYALKKARRAVHWKIGDTLLLSHPGCLLSCNRPYPTMLDTIITHLKQHRLTVLVTHWWEYFRDQRADGPFIDMLHETGDYLASQSDLKVVSFADVAEGRVPVD